jgi:hypothetical protein
MFHPILNHSERLTHDRLCKVAQSQGARVFAKVRIRDVLPIDNSGISAIEYRFALQSHFDFIVTDAVDVPLFAVEFDGPTHSADRQLLRDTRKNDLCQRFELPLLRINANYLKRQYRKLDLLSWFAECWFVSKAFDEAHENGSIPWDEPFDPAWITRLGGYDDPFPLCLCHSEKNAIRDLCDSGTIRDASPSTFIGVDQSENFFCYAFLRISKTECVYVTTGMRNQMFPIPPTEVLDQIAVCDLYKKLTQTLAGKRPPCKNSDIDRLVSEYTGRYKLRCASSFARMDDCPDSEYGILPWNPLTH